MSSRSAAPSLPGLPSSLTVLSPTVLIVEARPASTRWRVLTLWLFGDAVGRDALVNARAVDAAVGVAGDAVPVERGRVAQAAYRHRRTAA